MLHLVAGLAALATGAGILLRQPSRGRDRAFATLCAALSLWTLAYLAHGLHPLARPVYLLGSCASAPLALNFSLVLAGAAQRVRRGLVLLASLGAGLLWVLVWAPQPAVRESWPYAAVGVLGTILLAALVTILFHARALPPGPERRAMLYLVAGGLLATAGGLSDFEPRSRLAVLQLGPLGLLLFLLIVFVILVHHRFLDVDWLVARGVALVAAAAVVALVYFAVIRHLDTRYVTLFVLTLAVLMAIGPLARVVLARTRSLLRPADPVGRALLEVSRELPHATSAEQVWRTIERARLDLPADLRVEVWLRRAGGTRFHVIYSGGGGEEPRAGRAVPAAHALPLLLEREGGALNRRSLERDLRDARSDEERRQATEALGEFDRADSRIVVPLLARGGLFGWIALGGGLPERALTAELATELQAVGHQTTAALQRIEAIETARRKASLAAVGELAAGLAHEVRNPVAAIRGAVQAMGPGSTEAQREEMLEVIEEETGRLGRVVGEFLDYARPASPRREPVDLEELARGVIRSARLAGRALQVDLRARTGVPAVSGDPDQLRRVFENLVRNAWEAAGDGGRLMIDVETLDARRVAARFEDDGPGVPAEQLPRLFQPFQSGRAGGAGLGLALAYRIVEAHGGEIRVDGRPGVGAVFSVILPVHEDGASG
jgi:signal transduction histidine kinase